LSAGVATHPKTGRQESKAIVTEIRGDSTMDIDINGTDGLNFVSGTPAKGLSSAESKTFLADTTWTNPILKSVTRASNVSDEISVKEC
jgi:hypothetical protein